MLLAIELCTVALSAVSGVLEAGRKEVDLLGAPEFWIADQTCVYAAVAASILAFFAVRFVSKFTMRVVALCWKIGLP